MSRIFGQLNYQNSIIFVKNIFDYWKYDKIPRMQIGDKVIGKVTNIDFNQAVVEIIAINNNKV